MDAPMNHVEYEDLAAGYVLGALVAEAALSRPERTLTRAASLEPRTLAHYLPGYAIWAQRLIPVLAVGLVPGAAALEGHPSGPRELSNSAPSRRGWSP